MPETTCSGLIIRAQSGFFSEETAQGQVTCQLLGRLKQGARKGDIAAVGDRVEISLLSGGEGMIESVHARRSAIVRLDPRPQGVYRQILLANPDQAVFVFSCAQPEPRLRMLDRFLVITEKQRIPALVVANKVDLIGQDRAEEIFGHYPRLGYPVLYTSAHLSHGLSALRAQLQDKLSALAGPSGAGKSSLLNALDPGLGLAVNTISTAVNKGRHTTVTRQLFPFPGGGYVADTPGWKSLALWDTSAEEIDAYFPELAPLVAHCQFSDCSHEHEPGCAVRAAVERGEVHPARYDSYRRLRAGQE
jgi:ribosome biogenesis GTPase